MELAWEALDENMELEPLIKPAVERVQLVKYAGASGDFNPLHTVEEFARQAGLDGVIAHGMLSMGFLGQYLRHLLGARGDILRMKVRFQRMVKPGDVLTCRGTVRALRRETRVAELEMEAINQHGDVVTAGTAEVRFF